MVSTGRRVALEPRRRPRRRLPRAAFLLLVLATLAVAVSSVIRTSAQGPDPRLAYLDEVRPAVDRSTRQGAELAGLRAATTAPGPDGLRRTFERLQAGTAEVRDQVVATRPPEELVTHHGLLLAAMTARHEAVRAMAAALAGALRPGGEAEASLERLVEAGADLAVGDRAYVLFLSGLPDGLDEAMPASVWLGDATVWSVPEVSAWVAGLRASASLAPVHDVAVVTVTVDPLPVGRDGEHTVIPEARQVRLQIVVANVGNEAERRVPVEAVVQSAGGMDTAREFVDLDAGQRQTLTLPLRPAPPGPFTVTVRVGPVAGETTTTDNDLTPPLLLMMR